MASSTLTQSEDGQTETNDRLIGVTVHSYDHQNLKAMSDVSKTLLSQLEAFFVSYNKQRGKRFRIIGTGGPKKAVTFLKGGIRKYKAACRKLLSHWMAAPRSVCGGGSSGSAPNLLLLPRGYGTRLLLRTKIKSKAPHTT